MIFRSSIVFVSEALASVGGVIGGVTVSGDGGESSDELSETGGLVSSAMAVDVEM